MTTAAPELRAMGWSNLKCAAAEAGGARGASCCCRCCRCWGRAAVAGGQWAGAGSTTETCGQRVRIVRGLPVLLRAADAATRRGVWVQVPACSACTELRMFHLLGGVGAGSCRMPSRPTSGAWPRAPTCSSPAPPCSGSCTPSSEAGSGGMCAPQCWVCEAVCAAAGTCTNPAGSQLVMPRHCPSVLDACCGCRAAPAPLHRSR